jgi:hypothetical protein
MTIASAINKTVLSGTVAGVAAVSAGLFAASSLPLSGTAEAAPRQPNYGAYCARMHPGSFVNRLNTTGEYICTQRSAYQLRHYRVNLAQACQLTTGNPSYRNFGRGYVLCNERRVVTYVPRVQPRVQPRPSRIVMRAPNISAYCARMHPGSFVNRFRATGEYICTQRFNYQLRHYRINMAQACMLSWRTTAFRYVGGVNNPQCLVRS